MFIITLKNGMEFTAVKSERQGTTFETRRQYFGGILAVDCKDWVGDPFDQTDLEIVDWVDETYGDEVERIETIAKEEYAVGIGRSGSKIHWGRYNRGSWFNMCGSGVYNTWRPSVTLALENQNIDTVNCKKCIKAMDEARAAGKL